MSIDRQPSLASLAYHAIKADIVTCRLPGGAHMTELELVGRFGFGKTPTREALMMLVRDGLVQVLPRRGYLVVPTSIKDAEEIFNLRLVLEPEAARLAAGRVDGDQLRELSARCEDEARLPREPGVPPRFAAHRELHVAVARASDSRRLIAMIGSLLDDSERLFHLAVQLGTWPTGAPAHHLEFVEALIAGEGEWAAEIIAARVRASRDQILETLLASPQLRAVPIGVSAGVVAS